MEGEREINKTSKNDELTDRDEVLLRVSYRGEQFRKNKKY